MNEKNNISFEMPAKVQSSMIKVVGVGGGGGNAVNYMCSQDINGVDFVIYNTDLQALAGSPIRNKVQLGVDELGTGAGGNPEKGAQAASESIDEIQQSLAGDTKMVFITAGMGGGTGTGAAPIIAGIAKEMGFLVVGIVTQPFSIEGKKRQDRARKGVEALRKNVDSLIVINNDKLREVYGNLGITAGYAKADEVLSIAAKGIAEVITNYYKQNIDFQDAKTVLENSGSAIMGASTESGEDRARKAIVKALDSPLLNDNKITGAKNVLLLIVSGKDEITFDEVHEITEYIQNEAGHEAEIFLGYGQDDSLEDGVALTVVATGFAVDQQNAIESIDDKRIVHLLENNQEATYDFEEKEIFRNAKFGESIFQKDDLEDDFESEDKIVHQLESEKEVVDEVYNSSNSIYDIDVTYEVVGEESGGDFIITEEVVNDFKLFEEEVPASTQQNLFDKPIPNSKKTSKQDVNTLVRQNENIEEVTEQVERRYVLGETVENNKSFNKVSGGEQVTADQVEKRYVLGERSSEEQTVFKTKESRSLRNNRKEVEDERLKFELKIKPKEEGEENVNKEISPIDCTIEELRRRSKERQRTMKNFNHRFSSTLNNSIDELESLPAYKRQGLEVDVNSKPSKEKTVLRKKNESDDDLGVSNNSFLHDNVD